MKRIGPHKGGEQKEEGWIGDELDRMGSAKEEAHQEEKRLR